jgi:hypothetical protein
MVIYGDEDLRGHRGSTNACPDAVYLHRPGHIA